MKVPSPAWHLQSWAATSGFLCDLYCDPCVLRLSLAVCCCCSTSPSGRSCPFFCCRALCSPWGTKNNSGGFQYARHEGCGCQEQRLDPCVPQKEQLSILSTLLQVINPGNKGGLFSWGTWIFFKSTILFSWSSKVLELNSLISSSAIMACD